MPKRTQEHLDARRRQILDAARTQFAEHGFSGTSMADVVAASGLSTGAIYRYFRSKDELVVAVCEQASENFPTALTAASLTALLEGVRTLAREHGHARLVAQVYAEAALSPALAAVVQAQLADLRTRVAALLADRPDAAAVAEAFVALSAAYSQQLAVRGDVDPAPYVRALLAVVG